MSDLLQILKGTGVRPRGFFYVNGALADIDGAAVPTVTITRPDATTIASGTVTKVAATTGTYEFTLGTQPECTFLTVTWSGLIGGVTETITTYVEVVGAFLFTTAEAKAFDRGAIMAASNTPTVTDADLLDTRARITDEFTDILGFSPIPRYRRAVLDGGGTGLLLIPDRKAHRLISVTVNGTVQTVGNYTLQPHGTLEATSAYTAAGTFTAGRANVIVEYVHGDQRVDPATSRAGLIVAKAQLVNTDVSDRTTSVSGDFGTFSLATAGRTQGGAMSWYGLPLVDSVLNRRSQRGLAVA
jgi:hypothetical protein